MLPESVVLPLTVRGEGRAVASSSGLNWGQRIVGGRRRNPDEAYIHVPSGISQDGFFPPPREVFRVLTDDGEELDMKITGDPPKNLQTAGDLSRLGQYFRRRLGVRFGDPVTIEDLTRYGRTDVRFERGDTSYLMDFSVASRPATTNTTTDLDFETSTQPTEAGSTTRQGRSTDAELNKRVELHAMEMARAEMERIGWTEVEDTSANHPYDFTARSAGRLVFVEVKGTQSRGEQVVLTRNEVRHVQENPESSALIVVHSIEVVDRIPMSGSGILEFVFPWRIDDRDLEAVQFDYQTSRIFRTM